MKTIALLIIYGIGLWFLLSLELQNKRNLK